LIFIVVLWFLFVVSGRKSKQLQPIDEPTKRNHKNSMLLTIGVFVAITVPLIDLKYIMKTPNKIF